MRRPAAGEPRSRIPSASLFAAADRLKDLPELTSIELYAGTAAPFNFNGLVRHYYLREQARAGRSRSQSSAQGRARAARAMPSRSTSASGCKAWPGRRADRRQGRRGAARSARARDAARRDLRTRRSEPRASLPTKVREAFGAVDFVVDIDDSFQQPVRAAALLDRPGDLEFSRRRRAGCLRHHRRHHRRREGRLLAARRRRQADRDHVALPRSARDGWASASCRRRCRPAARARQGANVELGDVVTIKREPASYPIFRHNGRFAEMVPAEVAGRFEAPIYGMLAVEDEIAKLDWGKAGGPPEIQYHGQPADDVQADAAVGRRVGGDLRDLPRHGRRLHRGDPRHLPARGRPVRLLPPAARDPDARAADPDRHRARSLDAGRAVHRDLDDRLHRACRHHRAQLDPARRLHPAPAPARAPACATRCSRRAPSASSRSSSPPPPR